MVRGALLAARRVPTKGPEKVVQPHRHEGRLSVERAMRYRSCRVIRGILAGRTPGAAGLHPHRLARHLRVVRRIGQVAEAVVPGLPLEELEQRLDTEGVV